MLTIVGVKGHYKIANESGFLEIAEADNFAAVVDHYAGKCAEAGDFTAVVGHAAGKLAEAGERAVAVVSHRVGKLGFAGIFTRAGDFARAIMDAVGHIAGDGAAVGVYRAAVCNTAFHRSAAHGELTGIEDPVALIGIFFGCAAFDRTVLHEEFSAVGNTAAASTEGLTGLDRSAV